VGAPKTKMPGFGKPVLHEHIAAFLQHVQDHRLVQDYAIVDVAHNGTDLNVNVNHGLGRAYVGAIQIGASESDPVVVCILPETARDDGVDITKQARFRQPTADAMTTRWLVL
jgi:uncharacterized Fe-S cluster-containing radical SAM superfamily enzyme